MIHAKNINLSFGAQTIFDNVSFAIQKNQRIGLVGSNGSGKSTLLKVVAGLQNLDGGALTVINRSAVAYMPQDVILKSDKNVYDEAFCAFEKLQKLLVEEKKLDQQIKEQSTPDLIDRYAQVHEELAQFDPHKAISKTKQVLIGLGFSEEQQKQPVSELSVGWKMRLVLAKLLLKDADFYLFDEPTNHLDIVAKDWFLQFLKKSSFGFLLVCHDRYFLDQLCDEIIALEFGKGKRYRGNYSFYEKQREHDLEVLRNSYEQQQREIKQKKATIDRFRAKASKSKMAKSMEKELAKIKRIILPQSSRNVSFSFPPVQRAGRVVLKVENVAHAFGTKKIFENVSFNVERGQRVALTAPNGTGKSTLFNLICGELELQKGEIEFGYKVEHALFAQDQNESLNLNNTVLQNIDSNCSNKSESIIRSFLGAFLFSGKDVDKKVKVLSGGEKNRVSMISVLLQDANLLLLDEPTNHLDIQSKEVLLNALNSYKGTIIFVSHDRDFINRLATHVVELEPTGSKMYHGNYDSYLYQKQHENEAASDQSSNSSAKKSASSKHTSGLNQKELYELRKQIKKIENKINKTYKLITECELTFANIRYGTPEFEEHQKKLQKHKDSLEDLTKKWESAQKKVDH